MQGTGFRETRAGAQKCVWEGETVSGCPSSDPGFVCVWVCVFVLVWGCVCVCVGGWEKEGERERARERERGGGGCGCVGVCVSGGLLSTGVSVCVWGVTQPDEPSAFRPRHLQVFRPHKVPHTLAPERRWSLVTLPLYRPNPP